MLSDEFLSAEISWMAGSWGVMVLCSNILAVIGLMRLYARKSPDFRILFLFYYFISLPIVPITYRSPTDHLPVTWPAYRRLTDTYQISYPFYRAYRLFPFILFYFTFHIIPIACHTFTGHVTSITATYRRRTGTFLRLPIITGFGNLRKCW